MMNQIIKKYLYKNKISIIFLIIVIGILLYSFFFPLDKKVDSYTESFNEEKNKSINTEVKILENHNITNKQIINNDNISKELKAKTEDNKNISKKKKIIEHEKQKVQKNEMVSKSKKKEVSDQNDPTETIHILHSGLEKISLKKSYEGKEIVGLINKTFDIEKMVSIIIGNSWNDLNSDSRKDLVSVFGEYVSRNYFKRFSKINQPKFIIDDQKKVSQFLLIKTVLIIKNTEEVRIDYLLSNEKNGWKIFDVLIDGAISEIATKKSEFSVYIKNDNIDSLIKALREINIKLIKD